MKNKTAFLRLSVSILFLAYIGSKIDLAAVRASLAGFSPALYAAGFCLLLASQFIQALMLKVLMEPDGAGAFRIFQALAVAVFFGIFLPGSAGPDIVLAYNLSRGAPKKEKVLSAVILARGAVLVSSVTLALIFTFAVAAPVSWLRSAYILILAIFAVFALLALNAGRSGPQARVLSFLQKNRFTNLLHKTYFSFSGYRGHGRVFMKLIPLAAAASFLRITVDFAVSRALGLSIPLPYFLAFVPMVSIAAIIPVSISGLGVREGAYVELFKTAGFDGAGTFSISILSFTMGILFALFGALVYVKKGAEIKPDRSRTDAG